MSTQPRLEQLPPELENALPQIRDEWLASGLSTKPANRPLAEEGVRKAYVSGGLPPPAHIVWLDSPFGGAIGAAMLAKMATLGDLKGHIDIDIDDEARLPQVRETGAASSIEASASLIWHQMGAQLLQNLRGKVDLSQGWVLYDLLRGSKHSAAVNGSHAASNEQLENAQRVWDALGRRLLSEMGGDFASEVREQLFRAGYGQHDVSWLAFYDVFARAGIEACKRLEGLMQLARNAGWFWPFRGLCIITERPCQLHRDERGRLHNLSGPAIQYPDGWAVYAIHGIRVDEHVVLNPASIQVSEISQQHNAEVRRVLLERMGVERYIREIGAKPIQRDEWGTLYRVDIPNDEPLVMVAVVNSTREPDGSFKDYWLRVPPNMRSAREAIAWTFSLPEHEYNPTIMT